LRGIVSTHLFEPDVHTVGQPSAPAELTVPRERIPWLPGDLFAIYRSVGPVSLPDIANGYFVHPPDGLITADVYPGRVNFR
jgi:hypothetical protein